MIARRGRRPGVLAGLALLAVLLIGAAAYAYELWWMHHRRPVEIQRLLLGKTLLDEARLESFERARPLSFWRYRLDPALTGLLVDQCRLNALASRYSAPPLGTPDVPVCTVAQGVDRPNGAYLLIELHRGHAAVTELRMSVEEADRIAAGLRR
jgi:hypothetical protein